jgi:PAS domain S-box-containing protein
VVGVVTLIAVEGLLIAVLLVSRANRRRSEGALRESEARFRLMADAAPILIWTSGVDKACTFLNRPWLEFTGRPLERELGDGWAEGVHPNDLTRCLQVYATHFDARAPFEMVYRLRRHDGEYRRVLDRGAPRFTPRGEFVGFIGTCSDITELRRAEDRLRANQQELRRLAGRLLETQESERRRVARELHDDINQGLALLAVEIDILARSPPDSAATVTDRLRELSARARDLSSSVHDLSHQLHPSTLEQLGLVAAVRELCRDVGHGHGLEVKFTHFPDPGPLSPAAALCLYRIAQEALRNVVKHSGAGHAAVELSASEVQVRLRVADDGAGFDPTVAHGLGLVSMQERLNLVGGRLAIDSRPAAGTRIDAIVPAAGPASSPSQEHQP